MKAKYNWLYQIRGMAILAVVVCHQQGLLHQSEWVQLFTLYSVTTLIFCAGITKAFSIKKAMEKLKGVSTYALTKYFFEKIFPIICAYIVATMAYMTLNREWTGLEWDLLWDKLITFSASPPFYFFRYYIMLSIIAPGIYGIAFWILKEPKKKRRISAIVLFMMALFMIGYLSIGLFDSLGQSYLFIYGIGIVVGIIDRFPKCRPFQLPVFLGGGVLGLWSTKQFYWERVEGNYSYAKGLDLFTERLQMNPPNISIIIYSFGCICIFYWIFRYIQESEKVYSYVKKTASLVGVLGKYSLDIFIWHLFIQRILCLLLMGYLSHIWVKSVIFYSAMLFFPVLGRIVYTNVKNSIYRNISNAI